MACVDLGNCLRRTLGHDPATLCAAVGPQVDEPVSGFHHIEVVFDDDDRIAECSEPVENVEQLANVVEMQTGRRLVQDVERLARPLLDQLVRA